MPPSSIDAGQLALQRMITLTGSAYTVTVSRMTRSGNTASLQPLGNPPIDMTIQPKGSPELWHLIAGARVEDLFNWAVILTPGLPEPDIKPGDVLDGYRDKQLEVRSVNAYGGGTGTYLGGVAAAYTHTG